MSESVKSCPERPEGLDPCTLSRKAESSVFSYVCICTEKGAFVDASSLSRRGVRGASKIQLSSSFFPKGGSVAGVIDANMATFAGSFEIGRAHV